MKLVLWFSLFSVLIVASRAALRIENGVHKDYPGVCYLKFAKLILKPGDETRRYAVCEKIFCDNEYQLHFETCDNELGPGEKRANVAAKYPDCCKKA